MMAHVLTLQMLMLLLLVLVWRNPTTLCLQPHSSFTLVFDQADYLKLESVYNQELEIYSKRRPPVSSPHVVVSHNLTDLLQQMCLVWDHQRTPLAGSLNAHNHNLLRSFSSTFRVPYFTWSSPRWSLDHLTAETNLSNSPTCHIYSLKPDLGAVVVDLLFQKSCTTFVYLYTSDQAFLRMQQIVHKLHEKFPGNVALNVDPYFVDFHNITAARAQLKHVDFFLSQQATRTVVIDEQRRPLLENVILVLRSLGMLRFNYQFIFMCFNLLDLPLGPYKSNGVHVIGFSMLDYNSIEFTSRWSHQVGGEAGAKDWHDVAFFLDTWKTVITVQERWAASNRSPHYYRWQQRNEKMKKCSFSPAGQLLKYPALRTSGSSYSVDDLINLPDGVTGPISFDRKTCQRTGSTLLLSEFHGDQGTRIIGKWTQSSGLTLHEEGEHITAKEEKPVDKGAAKLQAGAIRVVTILSEPFMLYAPNVKGKPTSGKKNFVGFCKDLADRVFDKLKLEYELHLVHDGKYGAFDRRNKTWNGIIGEIVTGKADMAIAPLTVSSSRERDVDFTEPFMTFGLSVIIKKPEKTKPGTFSFMFPLSNQIWWCVGFASVAVALGLAVISKISPYEWDRPEEQSFSFANSFWFALAAVVNQSVNYAPLSPGARIVSSIWCFFSLLMIAYYTANLAAFLSVERLIVSISSVRDLVDKKNLGIQVGTLASGSTMEFFATSKMYPYKEIHDIMQADKSVYALSTDEGIRRVREKKGKYAFIMESKMVAFVNNRPPCDTMEVDSPFSNKDYAIAISQANLTIQTLKKSISSAILELREDQELAKMYTKWWIEKGECSAESSTTSSASSPLALVNLSGVFYILISGTLIACCVALGSVLGVSLHFAHQRREVHRSHHTVPQPQQTSTGDRWISSLRRN